ncbi:MAG TPA: hypothetical protein VMH26_00275 [Burkholderiales bacterium]|nr:hypothetical protein [Burkholderiales bacterium]
MYGNVLILRFLVRLLTVALPTAYATIGGAAQPTVLKADPCVEELRGGQSQWIECYGVFETDDSTQAELSRQTFDMVRSARCGGTIRVLRAALMKALAGNGVLELDPQDVLCSITTSGDSKPQLTITLAPRVLFQEKRIADISPRLMSITSLPDFLVTPLRSAAESEFVRSQLTRGLNVYLEQAFPR